MERQGIELNGSLQEQEFWALSFTRPLTSQKGTLRLFKKKNLSLEILSQKAWGENLWVFCSWFKKLQRSSASSWWLHRSKIWTSINAKLSLSFPHQPNMIYEWICLCVPNLLMYIHLCIIQHGIVQCLLWWQRNPCKTRIFFLQPQSAHGLFTHVFFSSVSANPLLTHYPSFSL